jgi:hypothetical protein
MAVGMRGAPMFAVKWVIRGKEAEPVESEDFGVFHADVLVSACRYRMEMMRRKYPDAPPDGFMVFDAAGQEIGRWFGSGAMP